jgi:hypothetical protein
LLLLKVAVRFCQDFRVVNIKIRKFAN